MLLFLQINLHNVYNWFLLCDKDIDVFPCYSCFYIPSGSIYMWKLFHRRNACPCNVSWNWLNVWWFFHTQDIGVHPLFYEQGACLKREETQVADSKCLFSKKTISFTSNLHAYLQCASSDWVHIYKIFHNGDNLSCFLDYHHLLKFVKGQTCLKKCSGQFLELVFGSKSMRSSHMILPMVSSFKRCSAYFTW